MRQAAVQELERALMLDPEFALAQEERWITAGLLDNRLVVLVWTRRGRARRVISMRKVNAREQARFAYRLG